LAVDRLPVLIFVCLVFADKWEGTVEHFYGLATAESKTSDRHLVQRQTMQDEVARLKLHSLQLKFQLQTSYRVHSNLRALCTKWLHESEGQDQEKLLAELKQALAVVRVADEQHFTPAVLGSSD
jgi:hypothetical protein